MHRPRRTLPTGFIGRLQADIMGYYIPSQESNPAFASQRDSTVQPSKLASSLLWATISLAHDYTVRQYDFTWKNSTFVVLHLPRQQSYKQHTVSKKVSRASSAPPRALQKSLRDSDGSGKPLHVCLPRKTYHRFFSAANRFARASNSSTGGGGVSGAEDPAPGRPPPSVGGRSGSWGVRTPALLASAEIFSMLMGDETAGVFSLVDSYTSVAGQRGRRPVRSLGASQTVLRLTLTSPSPSLSSLLFVADGAHFTPYPLAISVRYASTSAGSGVNTTSFRATCMDKHWLSRKRARTPA